MTAGIKCAACGRDALPTSSSGGDHHCYCSRHAAAFERMQAHHAAWARAYGQVPWEEYLDRLSKMKETGDLVKQVIEAEIRKKGKGKKGG